MKLRRINESIEDLVQSVEYTLLSLRDNGFFVSVLQSGESIEVVIRISHSSYSVAKTTEIEPIYSYLEEAFDYIKHYDKEITNLKISPISFAYTDDVYVLDESTGKITDKTTFNNDFNELRNSIDFCLFTIDCDYNEFYQIKFYVE